MPQVDFFLRCNKLTKIGLHRIYKQFNNNKIMKNPLRQSLAKKVIAFAFLIGVVSPSALASQPLLVAAVAPVIQSLNVSTSTGSATVSFSLNTTATTTVWIKDASSNIVKTLIFDNNLTGGTLNSFTWNGTDNNNGAIASGSYNAQVVAYNSASSDIKNFPFTFTSGSSSVQAPVVSVNVSPTTFDPTKGQTTTVSYSLNQPASLSVLVKLNGSLIKTLRAQSIQTAGSYNLAWDGTSDQSVTMGPNNFVVEVYANNIAGTDIKSAGVTIASTGTISGAPHLTSLSANPTPFNPSTVNTRINFTLDTTANVTVAIMDGANTIKTLVSNTSLSAGSYFYEWNGRDSSGLLVADKVYTARVMATNSLGTDTQSTNVQVSTTGTGGTCNTITSNFVYPSNVNINSNDAQINYILANSALITVRIKDSSGFLIRTLVSQTQSAGSQMAPWNGLNSAGNLVPSGTYTYEITASVSGCSDEIETGSFFLTSNGSNNYVSDYPSTNENLITNLLVTPEVFRPLNGERANISLYLSRSAKLRLEVLNGTSVIKSISNTSSNQSSGNYSYTWDGRDNNGNIAPDALYQVRAMADDGNNTDTDRASVELDTDGIIIGFATADRCAGFRDVSVNSPFCKAIELMSKAHIFEGYSDGTFRPYEKINRAETAKVVVLALGYNVNTGSTFSRLYRDTISGAWYVPYLMVAKDNGIATGYPDGTFRPATTINRVELLRVFLEANHLSLSDSCAQPFDDTPIRPDTNWYMKYACYAKYNGLMNSDTSSKLFPGDAMTRGDVASLFYDFEVKGLYSGVNGMNIFSNFYNNTNNSNVCTQYDTLGNCLSYSNNNNSGVCTQYDSMGNCMSYSNNNSGTCTQYDTLGNCLSYSNNNNSGVCAQHDAYGNCVSIGSNSVNSYCTRYGSNGTCLQYGNVFGSCIQYNANGSCSVYGNNNTNTNNSNGYYTYQNGQYVWVSY
jgi:flagellar hook assembly protein FlgD